MPIFTTSGAPAAVPFPYTADVSLIPTAVLVRPDGSDVIVYQCPDTCWTHHNEMFRRALREDSKAPMPMPFGHLMFESPIEYGFVRLEDLSNEGCRRKAMETRLRADLLGGGWAEGASPAVVHKIVQATTAATLNDDGPGAAPFFLCMLAGAA